MKWHMRLTPGKTKSMAVSRSRTYAAGYDDLTLGSEELEEVKSLRILAVTFDSKLTLEIHLREAVPKAAKSLDALRRVGKLFLLSTCAQELFQCIWFAQLGVLCPRVDIVCRVSFEFA